MCASSAAFWAWCWWASTLETDLVKVLDRNGLAAFERRVREWLDGVAHATPATNGRDAAYRRRRAAEILRATLAKQRDVEAYIALCEASELLAGDCLALAGARPLRGCSAVL
jgi:hypothetical protein